MSVWYSLYLYLFAYVFMTIHVPSKCVIKILSLSTHFFTSNFFVWLCKVNMNVVCDIILEKLLPRIFRVPGTCTCCKTSTVVEDRVRIH